MFLVLKAYRSIRIRINDTVRDVPFEDCYGHMKVFEHYGEALRNADGDEDLVISLSKEPE